MSDQTFRNPDEVEILFRLVVNNTYVTKVYSIPGSAAPNEAVFQQAVRDVAGDEVNAICDRWTQEGVEKYGFDQGQFAEDLPTLYLFQDIRTSKHIEKHQSFEPVYGESVGRMWPRWYKSAVLRGSESQLRIEVHICWSYEDPNEYNRERAFYWLAFLGALKHVGQGRDLLQEKTLDLAVLCNDGEEALFLGNNRRMLKLDDASNGYVVSDEIPPDTRQFFPRKTLQLATACEICMAVAGRVGWDVLRQLLEGPSWQIAVSGRVEDVTMTED